MTTCNECEHSTPPAVLDAGHPCFSCKGDRVVIDGSNFKEKLPVIQEPNERVICPDCGDACEQCGMAICIETEPSVFEDGK